MGVDSHKIMIIFQISCVLAAFHKYYEFKNFVELLPYKKAIEKCKESFNEMICTYRAELVRRLPFNTSNSCKKVNKAEEISMNTKTESDQKVLTKPFILQICWQVLFFLSLMMSIFGAMFENQRLLVCGYYAMFELACEMIDAGMSWMERR